MPLRGTSRLTDTTRSASAATPNARRVAPRRSSSIGTNRSVSTPGGTDSTGSGRPAARSPSAAGYEPAATTTDAPRSTRPSTWRGPGTRPGTVISAPWRITP